jgi:phage gp29-like protein
LRYLDGMMSQSVLGGWMDLAGAASQSGAGSYALSSDQSGLFLQSRHGSARELTATINYQIIRPLVRVNFGPKAPVPLLKIEKIGSEQVAKAMELLQTLGASQNLQVPSGFIHMLIERVAAYLDLPDDRVRKMVEEAAKQEREAEMMRGVPMPPPGSPEGNLQDAVAGALATVTGPGSPGQPPAGPGPAPTQAAA